MQKQFVVLAVLLCCTSFAGAAEDPMSALIATNKTAPQGYPTGKDERGIPYAQPDTSGWFRWHFYNEDAIQRFEDAKMLAQSDLYNGLEDARGIRDTSGKIKFAPVAEHVTEGKQALRVDFPAIPDAFLTIDCSGKVSMGVSKFDGPIPWFPPNYRWLKIDVFNPAPADVRVCVARVPLVLRPGANVITVKTADLSGFEPYSGSSTVMPVRFEVVGAATLYLDNVRMEQEVPELISKKGKLFQFGNMPFPGLVQRTIDSIYSAEAKSGWTAPVKTRNTFGYGGWRSMENGLLWSCVTGHDAPFRVDLENGRYGVYVFLSASLSTYAWEDSYLFDKGAVVKINGKDHTLFEPKSKHDVRQSKFSGETWDFRPGACLWEGLVRQPYYPVPKILVVDVANNQMSLEFPRNSGLHALIIFPEQEKVEALKELGRFNYILAECWDVTHGWVKGAAAERTGYIGFHEEAARPESIPERLRALNLSTEDFQRGFVAFQRGLMEGIYPDTIPRPPERSFKELRALVTPGERNCITVGLLPLKTTKTKIQVGDLASKDGPRIPAASVDVRVGRYHQKTVDFWHHNQFYNYEEQYLIRRAEVELHPGAARRLYIDISVPPEITAGQYTGEVSIFDGGGKKLSGIPIVIDVLPIQLQKASAYFASDCNIPEILKYGFNTFWTSRDIAVKHGAAGYIDWAPKNADHLTEAGSKNPRALFWGYNTGERALNAEAANSLLKNPHVSLISFNIPTYPLWSTIPGGKKGLMPVGGPAQDDGSFESLEKTRKAKREFWMLDQMVSREHLARFSMGVWLWRLGAGGRYVRFSHYGGGNFDWPYYKLRHGVGTNTTLSLLESQKEGEFNPSRDLLLFREGANDYRYLSTLEYCIKQAETVPDAKAAAAAATGFLERLRSDLAVELTAHYKRYDHNCGGEYWVPLPDNKWTGAKFDEFRRECAEHIMALQQALQK